MDNINHIKATLEFEDIILNPKVENLLKDFDENKINESELVENIILLTQQQLNKIKQI